MEPTGPREARPDDRLSEIRGSYHAAPSRIALRFMRATAPSPIDLDVLVHKRDHAVEHVAGLRQIRRVAGVPLRLDVFERDLAAGLAVVGDEALGLVLREARFRVLVVVQHVAASLEPDRGRREHLLAALERQHRIALRHVGLALPIGVLARDDRFRPLGWIGAGLRALGMPVTAERIDHRP